MKATYGTQAEIPEAQRGEYEEKDGQFVLKVEGDHPVITEYAGKVKSFRENNIKLAKEAEAAKTAADALAAKFKDIDPGRYAEMSAKLADLEKTGVHSTDDVTKRVLEEAKRQVEAALAPVQLALAEEKKARAEASASLQRKTLETRLRDAGVKAGVDEEHAMEDYIARGMRVFNLKDGEIVAMQGDAPIFSKNKPSEPLSPEEWAVGLQKEAPHLYKPSKGGGATGSGTPAPKRYISSDPVEFGKNLEAIAKGEVIVQRD